MTGPSTSDSTSDSTPVTPITSASSVLGATASVTVQKELTIEERLAAIEKVLNDYIVNPPKMADAEALSQRITAADNKATGAFQLSGATDTRLTDAAMQQEARFSARIQELKATIDYVQKMQSEMQVAWPAAASQIAIVRDEQHELRKVARHFTCSACSCEFSDVVMKAAVSGDRTCPNCGKGASVVLTDIPLDEVAA